MQMITVIAFICASTIAQCTPSKAYWQQKYLGFGTVQEACSNAQILVNNLGIQRGNKLYCIQKVFKE